MNRRIAKRALDILLSMAAMVVLAIPMLVIALLIRITSRGPSLYWSKRVGKDNEIFLMPKFRTMCLGTPALATHLLIDAGRYVTPLGRVLRRTSLDELPQVFSIVAGHMSFVGPRPALFNQDDLIALRKAKGVDRLTPGLTGWAQIHGRDELPIPVKVEYDAFYLRNMSLLLDIQIILRTCIKAIKQDDIAH